MVDAPTERDAIAAESADTASVPEAAFDVAPELFGAAPADAATEGGDSRPGGDPRLPDDTAL
ncbi:hypothetical protein [Halosimplex marinum]|uniref:hypothetical protein n=1 Tax=Halosimplex marinum TaxID=3396620 RepID=UPI003F565398